MFSQPNRHDIHGVLNSRITEPHLPMRNKRNGKFNIHGNFQRGHIEFTVSLHGMRISNK